METKENQNEYVLSFTKKEVEFVIIAVNRAIKLGSYSCGSSFSELLSNERTVLSILEKLYDHEKSFEEERSRERERMIKEAINC